LKKLKAGFPNSFKINNTRVTDRFVTAEIFNNFFSKIGMQTNQNVPNVNKKFKSYVTRTTPHSFFLDPVSPSDIVDIANN
jgi:hypothetical protein